MRNFMKYQQDLQSEYKELFLYARNIILSLDKQIVEKQNKCHISYYLHNRCITSILPQIVKTTIYKI